jgi:Flp pilus assembly pilin Flp
MRPGLAVNGGRMGSDLVALGADDSGATAIEYALIAALISMTIFIWAMSIGSSTTNMFMSIVSGL